MNSRFEISAADDAAAVATGILPSDVPMPPIELYTSQLCPFSLRVRLTLAEKNIFAWETEIDLRDKPAWFLAMSPGGRVPLVRAERRLIWESAVICEYLDEAYPGPRLLPEDHASRAEARMWVRLADDRLCARTRDLITDGNGEKRAAILEELADILRDLEHRLFAPNSTKGPYMLGADFSLVDIVFYPWFEQVCVLEKYFGFAIPAECKRLSAWRQTVASREPTRDLCRPPEFYLQAFERLFSASPSKPADGLPGDERRPDGDGR